MPKKTSVSLGDIKDAALKYLLGNRVNSKAGLAIGSVATKVSTAAALVYSVNGIMCSLAAGDIVLTTGLPVVPVGSLAWYLLCADAFGNVTTVQGLNVGQGQTDANTGARIAGIFPNNALPPVPAGTTAFGAVKVITDATHAFTPGTTAFNAAGITTTYYDLACVPDDDTLPLGSYDTPAVGD